MDNVLVFTGRALNRHSILFSQIWKPFIPCPEEIDMTKIRGRNDGPGGRNEHYDIGSRKNVPRLQVVEEIKKGKHPDAHVVTVKGREYARDNPDTSKKDNVNRRK